MTGLKLIGGVSTLLVLYLVFTMSSLVGASVAVEGAQEYDKPKETVTGVFDDVRENVSSNMSGAHKTVTMGMMVE